MHAAALADAASHHNPPVPAGGAAGPLACPARVRRQRAPGAPLPLPLPLPRSGGDRHGLSPGPRTVAIGRSEATAALAAPARHGREDVLKAIAAAGALCPPAFNKVNALNSAATRPAVPAGGDA